MKKSVLAALAAVVLSTSVLPSVASADDLRIAVVSMERILRDTKSAAIASERLNEEAKRRQDEVDALTKRFKQRLENFESKSASMSETDRLAERRDLAEMERDVTRRSREARDEFNQRRLEEVQLLQNRAGHVIQDIAKQEHYDLVLFEYFYASNRVDITQRVIDELDKEVHAKK